MKKPIIITALFILTLCGLFSSGCNQEQAIKAAALENTAFVISGYNVASGFVHNGISLIDTKNWKIMRKIALPRSWIKSYARDPHGNLWIGFSGDLQNNDNRVQIYSEKGELLKTLHVCDNPGAGISFSRGMAFIACTGDGFSGRIVTVNLDTFKTLKTIELSLPDAPWMLSTSAADENTVMVTGLTSGPEETSYCVLGILDVQTLTLQAPIRLGKHSDVWRILPHNGKFYLLNVSSFRESREEGHDVFVITPGSPPVITALETAVSPLWGTFSGDLLYMYHNETWNSTSVCTGRSLSQLNVKTGQVATWNLPDEWNANDIMIINGCISLVRWDYWSRGAGDGLYCFDISNGRLSLILNIVDASGVLFL
jgi:hypothetical protein